MKKLLLSSLVSVVLVGCGGSEDTVKDIVDEAKRIEITESNASQLIELASGFDTLTDSLTGSAGASSRASMSQKETVPCAISGDQVLTLKEESETSYSVSINYNDCVDSENTLQNGSMTAKATMSSGGESMTMELTGDMRAMSFENYLDMDIKATIATDTNGLTLKYTLDYDIVYPGLIGEVQVKTVPSIVFDNNDNTSGKVVITGKNDSKIEIVYGSNGETYYLNGTEFTPEF